MNLEVLKTAIFDVVIKSKNVNINEVGLSYDETKELIDRVALENPDDEKLQQEYNRNKNNFGFSGMTQFGFEYRISAYKPKVMAIEVQTCPYRMANPGPWVFEEGLDHWDLIGDDKCCSFCGSLHPERVLELIENEGFSIIESSDKYYKLYVNRKEIPNASFGGIKFYTYHFNSDQIKRYNELLKLSKENKN